MSSTATDSSAEATRFVSPARARRRSIPAVLAIVSLLVPGCSQWTLWSRDAGTERGVEAAAEGPLPQATAVLDELIAAGQRDGAAPDPKRMAHLRMTRSARDLMVEGRTERALDLLERAIAIDGRAGFGYLYLAELHTRLGHAEQARVFVERAAALLPTDRVLARELDGVRARAAALEAGAQVES